MRADRASAPERVRLARALLKADGTLRGPSLRFGDHEIAPGDRVVASREVPLLGLPAGTPGTVEQVLEASREARIDFATWGRLDVSVREMVATGINHAYVAHDVTASRQSDVTDELAVETNRIDPGAGG
jgi:hypothetical protein